MFTECFLVNLPPRFRLKHHLKKNKFTKHLFDCSMIRISPLEKKKFAIGKLGELINFAILTILLKTGAAQKNCKPKSKQKSASFVPLLTPIFSGYGYHLIFEDLITQGYKQEYNIKVIPKWMKNYLCVKESCLFSRIL